MTTVHRIPSLSDISPSIGFDSPFCNSPALIAQEAAFALQQQLESLDLGQHDFFAPSGGQIFGVLVVRDAEGQLGYLQAFSGQVAEQWQWPGFVSPAFNQQKRQAFLPDAQQTLIEWSLQLQSLKNDPAFIEAQRQLQENEGVMQEHTRTLQAQLVERKAARRVARETADEETLATLRGEGEADARLRADDKRHVRERLKALNDAVAVFSDQIEELSSRYASLDRETYQHVQASYQLPNAEGQWADLSVLFAGREPLEGIGDCAGAKLLSSAYRNNLRPIALAEFWWGAEPLDGVRHHRHFYPSCRGRCGPLLAFMLQGLPPGRQPDHLQPFTDKRAPEIVFEDRHLILVHKPAELLSVPGLAMIDSVQSRLQGLHPDLPELQLVHRLDQSTSGLLLLAKTRRDHKALQRQFTGRTINKEYIALLDAEIEGEQGEIDLPLRVDLEDRPRQMVCYQHGKPALTRWRVISREAGRTRVALTPVTGRTHQLRVHMAHVKGLRAPIVGDELYGKPGQRLHLHAQTLDFIHPGSGERVSFTVPAPF